MPQIIEMPIIIESSISLDETLSGYILYTQYKKWTEARHWIMKIIAVYNINILCATVHAVAFFGFAYALKFWFTQIGMKEIASWLGLMGLVSFYFGLLPTIVKSRTKNTVKKALRVSNPSLLQSNRPLILKIDRHKISISTAGRKIQFKRSEPIQLAENTHMIAMIIGGTITPLLKTKINPALYEAIGKVAETPRPSLHYFSQARSLEKIQFTIGILIFALNTFLYLEIFHWKHH